MSQEGERIISLTGGGPPPKNSGGSTLTQPPGKPGRVIHPTNLTTMCIEEVSSPHTCATPQSQQTNILLGCPPTPQTPLQPPGPRRPTDLGVPLRHDGGEALDLRPQPPGGGLVLPPLPPLVPQPRTPTARTDVLLHAMITTANPQYGSYDATIINYFDGYCFFHFTTLSDFCFKFES